MRILEVLYLLQKNEGKINAHSSTADALDEERNLAYNSSMWNIIGHHHLLAFFEHAQMSDHLSHAYLLTGPPHVGKQTLAQAFAQAILCTEQYTNPPGSPCGACRACQKVQSGTHPDLSIILPSEGKKAPTIEIIRAVILASALQPQEGRYSIFLLPNAELLTIEAANTLLKTLEEPSPQTILLLTSSEEQMLPRTIISRCQVLAASLVNIGEIRQALVTRWHIPDERATIVSALSAGQPGWAIGASQNQALQEERSAWLQGMNTLCESGPAQRIKLAARLVHDTEHLSELLAVWLIWWREALLSSEGAIPASRPDNIEINRYTRHVQPNTARQVIEQIQEAVRQLEQNANPRLVLEMLSLALPAIQTGQAASLRPLHP